MPAAPASVANVPGAEAEDVLRQPAFRRLLCGRVAAATAAQVQAIVVAWQLYALTHDPLTLGWVGLAQFAPMFLLILPAGDLVDRVDRRYLLAASLALQALAGGLFLLLTGLAPERVGAFYAVLVLFGVARAFAGPASQALLPQLVREQLLARAIAWNSSAFQIAVIGGPALGGAVYLLGPGTGYALCLLLFVISAILVAGIRAQLPRQPRSTGSSAFTRFTAGIRYVRGRPIILGAISLDLFAVLFGGATALLPVYAHDILHVGPLGLGALRSAIAVGAFVMGIYLGRRALERHAGPVMFAAVALFGLATLVFGASHWFWLSFVALAVAGAADMISVFVRTSLIQLATPDAMRGRVSAVNMLFITGSNELGEFESGVTAAWFGAVPAVLLGGAGTLAVVGLWMWWFPSLRRVDRLQDVSAQRGGNGN